MLPKWVGNLAAWSNATPDSPETWDRGSETGPHLMAPHGPYRGTTGSLPAHGSTADARGHSQRFTSSHQGVPTRMVTGRTTNNTSAVRPTTFQATHVAPQAATQAHKLTARSALSHHDCLATLAPLSAPTTAFDAWVHLRSCPPNPPHLLHGPCYALSPPQRHR